MENPRLVIHQLVHTLNYGDAISGEALAIRRICHKLSIDSKIYCLNAHEKVKAWATSWKEFSQDDAPRELGEPRKTRGLLFHFSLASPLNELFVQAREYYRIFLYHNLTPAHWYSSYNTRVVADLRRGREVLPTLISQADLVLADSEFNRQELLQLGAEAVETLPLLFDLEKWSLAANGGIERILKGHGGKNLLHVGRIAPNKCLEDIVKAFYFYHHKIEKRSRLWLIGSDIDTEIYAFELRRLVNELRLKEVVTFVGAVADCELKAFYQNSDLYLCMSEHEGFCVPLLEAMYFGVPIIAFDAGAVKDTAGDAGLLLARKAPAETAELMNLLFDNQGLKNNCIEQGRKRVEQFTTPAFIRTFQSLIVDRMIQQGISTHPAQGKEATYAHHRS